MKRIVSLLLALALALSICSALAEVTYPLAGDNLTLVIDCPEVANIAVVGSIMDTPFLKAYQEATGVKVTVRHPADMTLTFAGGNMGDIVFYRNWGSYPGGFTKAIEDGIILPIEDKVAQYAPDYYAALQSNDTWRRQAYTSDGRLPGFYFIRGTEILCTSNGLIIRDDWLNDLNLDFPETIEEFRNVLIAFRDEKGAAAPWSVPYWNLKLAIERGMITSPFNLPKGDFYVQDGKIKYGYYSQEMKEVLVWLNGLYSEGLLDKNLSTIDESTTRSNTMTGISGVTFGAAGGGIGNMMTTMADDPSFSVTGLGSLVANKGDKAMSGHFDNPVLAFAAVVTPNCENVELALQFLNYAWTEAGNLLCNFGIEGVSYTMVDGQPTYTDLIMNNPDGLTVTQALLQYSQAGTVNLVGYKQEEGYIWQYYNNEQQTGALRRWSNTDAKTYKMPPLSPSVEQADEFSAISAEVNTYVSESILKFITGAESLDNYDNYLETLRKMGVERLIEIYQIQYEAYLAK